MGKDRPPDSDLYRAEKLALGDRLRRDKELSAATRVVGAEIISRSWEAGGCPDAVNWFVTVLNLAPSTVKLAIAQLKDRGYIRIERQGRNNRYYLIFEQVRNSDLSRTAEPAGIGLNFDGDRSEKRAATGPKNDPLIPLEPFAQDPLEGDGDADEAAPLGTDLLKVVASLISEIAALAAPGARQTPRGWHDAEHDVLTWLGNGWTRDDILMGVTVTMSRKPHAGPPSSIRYFEREIGKAVSRRTETTKLANVVAGQSRAGTLAARVPPAQEARHEAHHAPAVTQRPARAARAAPVAAPAPPPAPFRDRGVYEEKIRAAIGDDCLDALALDDARLEGFCRRLKADASTVWADLQAFKDEFDATAVRARAAGGRG
jgi:DNA-binding transcriptional ArsR family regulator